MSMLKDINLRILYMTRDNCIKYCYYFSVYHTLMIVNSLEMPEVLIKKTNECGANAIAYTLGNDTRI